MGSTFLTLLRSKIMKHIPYLLLMLLIAIFSFFIGASWQPNIKPPATGNLSDDNILNTHIYPEAETEVSTGDWGSISIYTNDQTETYGTQNMLTAVLEFLPGKQLQDPHQHAEEEFTYIVAGGGTWNLNGIESVIQAGDLLYAKPWDMHGIKNTTDKPLKFFVVKWNNKNVASPDKPE